MTQGEGARIAGGPGEAEVLRALCRSRICVKPQLGDVHLSLSPPFTGCVTLAGLTRQDTASLCL